MRKNKLPKLLDVIKEKGLTHEEVLKLIESHSNKPEAEIEESVVEEAEEVEIDKPKEEIPLYLIKVESEEKSEEELDKSVSKD